MAKCTFQDLKAGWQMTKEEAETQVTKGLQAYLGEALLTPEDVNTAIGKVLQPIVGHEQFNSVDVKIDEKDPTLIHFTFPVPAAMLAKLAQSMYVEGKTHEEVTAWLERSAPDFRNILTELHLNELSQKAMDAGYHPSLRALWVLKPNIIRAEFAFCCENPLDAKP